MITESAPAIIQSMLTTTPPSFSGEQAALIAQDKFGISAKTQPLVSERDQNFRLNAVDGHCFTLKISNHAEQAPVVDFQNLALQHVADKDPSLPVPRVIPSLDGQLHCAVEHDGLRHFVRVLSWVDGRILKHSSIKPELVTQLGRLLAHLDLALAGFDHPGSNSPSLWDMKRASGLRELLAHIKDADLRRLVGQALDRFDTKVSPVLDELRDQVIYSDMNLGNVLMDEARPDRVSGLIDFGDMVKSPLIMDLAIASAYQLSDNDDPLGGALPMIAGYHAICPLRELEQELLLDLIKTRLVTSLLIGSYRAALFPDNREYLLTSYATARKTLTSLSHGNQDEVVQRIFKVCNAGSE